MKILLEKEDIQLILEHKGNKTIRFSTVHDNLRHDVDVDIDELNKAISFLTGNSLAAIIEHRKGQPNT
jgi:hypothetical protein